MKDKNLSPNQAITYLAQANITSPKEMLAVLDTGLEVDWSANLKQIDLEKYKSYKTTHHITYNNLFLATLECMARKKRFDIINKVWDAAYNYNSTLFAPSSKIEKSTLLEIAFENSWTSLIHHWLNKDILSLNDISILKNNKNIKRLAMQDDWASLFLYDKKQTFRDVFKEYLHSLQKYRDENRWLHSSSMNDLKRQRDKANLQWNNLDVKRYFAYILSDVDTRFKGNRIEDKLEVLFSSKPKVLSMNGLDEPLYKLLEEKDWNYLFINCKNLIGLMPKILIIVGEIAKSKSREEFRDELISSIGLDKIPTSWIRKDVSSYFRSSQSKITKYWLEYLHKQILKRAKQDFDLYKIKILNSIKVINGRFVDVDDEERDICRLFKEKTGYWPYEVEGILLDRENKDESLLKVFEEENKKDTDNNTPMIDNINNAITLTRSVALSISTMSDDELKDNCMDLVNFIYSMEDAKKDSNIPIKNNKDLLNYIWVQLCSNKRPDCRNELNQLLWSTLTTLDKVSFEGWIRKFMIVKNKVSKNPNLDVFVPLLDFDIIKNRIEKRMPLKDRELNSFIEKFTIQQSISSIAESKSNTLKVRKM